MDVNKFSIIIQGPLNIVSLSAIENYKKIANVIVSCWETDDFSKLNDIDLSDVVLVKSPSIKQNFFNYWNVGNQVTTIYAGLKVAKTEFSIKTRSDASFSNLQYLMDRMLEKPNKIFSGSVPFCKTKTHIYHAGDHVIGAKTSTFKLGMRILRDAFGREFKQERNRFDQLISRDTHSPEQYITRALLYANEEKFQQTNKASEIMKQHYEICKYKNLGDVVFTYQKGSKIDKFENGTYPDGLGEDGLDFNDISQIGD